jgi:hypothetical protein
MPVRPLPHAAPFKVRYNIPTMAHGTPDWGVTAGAVTVYQLTDLAEAVARLGSLNTFDRRGDLIWANGFEWGLAKWELFPGAGGNTIAPSTARARNGRYSVLLNKLAAGDPLLRLVHLSPLPAPGGIGFEYSFNLATAITSIEWWWQVVRAASTQFYRIRWDDAANELQYNDSAGVFVTFATTINLLASPSLFHTGKLVVDTVTGQYVRFILNDRTYSLANIAGQNIVVAATARLDSAIEVSAPGPNPASVYIDDVILTQNEPF